MAAAVCCMTAYRDAVECVTVFLFLCILIRVSFNDWKCMEIPDKYNVMIAGVSLISVYTMPSVSVMDRIIGGICISIPMLLLTVAVPGAFGGGDIKLSASCGLFAGWRTMAAAVPAAIFAAGGYICIQLYRGKKGSKDVFAFGPFLAVGMFAGLMWGEEFIRWYTKI